MFLKISISISMIAGMEAHITTCTFKDTGRTFQEYTPIQYTVKSQSGHLD